MDVIIGASGHLGNTLLRELAAEGRKVRPVFRSPPSFDLPVGVEPYICDAEDTNALTKALHRADTVYHAAGLVAIGINTYEKLYKANVEVTKKIVAASLKAGVHRLVYTGTIEAFDLLAGGYPITEQSPIRPDHTVMPYGKSKALAVLEVERAVEIEGLNAVTVFPTGFVGPFDYKFSPMTTLVLDFLRGRIRARITGGFDFVDVRDVAAGMISASKIGSPGDRYLLPGSFVTVEELFSLLELITGKPAPRLELPAGLLAILGPAAELFYLLSGKQPRYTRKSAKILSLGVTVSGELASKKLGYAPRPLKESLRDTVDWLVSAGYVENRATE